MASLGPGSGLSLQDMCTSIAAQALVRDEWSEFELEQRTNAMVTSQLERFEVLRRMCGPRILASVVHRCPQLLTDKLFGLLMAQRIQAINLPECTLTSAATLIQWIDGNRNSEIPNPDASVVTRDITKLDISGCTGLFADMAPEKFASRFLQHSSSLSTVNVSRTSVGDLFVQVLLTCCKRLHTLAMSDCEKITDNVFDFVAIDYPVLADGESVAWQVTEDRGATEAAVSTNMPDIGCELKCVDLSLNSALAYRALRKLAYTCRDRLETLNVSYCHNIEVRVLLCLCGYVITFPKDNITVTRVGGLAAGKLVHSGDPTGSPLNPFQAIDNESLAMFVWKTRLRLFSPRIADLNMKGVLTDSPFTKLSLSQFSHDTAATLRRFACGSDECSSFTLAGNALHGIEDLDLAEMNCTSLGIDVFCEKENNLRHLNLIDVDHDGEDVVKLCRSSARPWLSLRSSLAEINDDQMIAILESSASTLEVLDLYWCRSLTDESLSKVIQQCKSLRKFYCRNVQIGQRFVDALIQSKPSCLTDLCLRTSADILDDAHMLEIVPALPNLTHVNLAWNNNIGNESVRCLLLGCPALASLNLEGTLLTAKPFLPMVVIRKPGDGEIGVPMDSQTVAMVQDGLQVCIRRSTVYATNLLYLNVTSCHDIDNELLMTLARAAFGTLTINVNYAIRVTPHVRVDSAATELVLAAELVD